MTHQTFDTPLDAQVVDGEVVITGPDGFSGSLTLDAAKATLERLREALGAPSEPRETYQKPLG